MGLKRTPGGFTDELRASKLKVGGLLTTYESDIASYTTAAYRGPERGKFSPENHNYEWICITLPQMVSGTPVSRFSTTREGTAEVLAAALTFGYNHWARATNLRSVNERFGVDLAFRYAVALISSEPRPGFEESEDQPYWPSVRRLSLRRFLFDSAALCPEQWAWSAHLTIRPRDEIVALAEDGDEKGWDVARLKAMAANVRDIRKGTPAERLDRDEVAYWEVWVPDWAAPGEKIPKKERPEDGFHGWVYTVLDDETDKKEGRFIREKRRFFGPRTGPYVFVDGYPVPDQSVGLAPLVATRQQAEYLNRIKRATMRAVERYKNVLLARNASDELVQNIVQAEAHNVVKYEGEDVRESFAQFQVAGATEQHLVAAQDARQTLDRTSGLADAIRGNVTGDATAAENIIAGQAAATRSGFLVGKFLEFQCRIAYAVAYYMHRDEDVVMDLPGEAAGYFLDQQGQPIEQPELRGGLDKGENAEDFESLDLSIDVGSLSRTPEQANQNKLMQLDLTVDRVALLAPHAAYIDLGEYVKQRAELTGVPELEKLFDTQTMAMVSGMMLAAGMQQGGEAGGAQKPGGDAGSRPRLTGDIGLQSGKKAQPKQSSLPTNGAAKPKQKGAGALPVSSR